MAVLGCLAVLTISVFGLYSTTASAGTPNIVVFFVDDVSCTACLHAAAKGLRARFLLLLIAI